MTLKRVFRVLFALILFAILFVSACEIASLVMKSRVQSTYENSALDDVDYIAIDGHALAYRHYDGGHEHTIVFVHGFMGSSFDFHPLSVGLSDTYNIVAVDLLGFGKSDKPLDYEYTKDNHAKTVKAALDALGIVPYALGGHSMGGEVVLRLTHLYPDFSTHLILISSAGLQEGRRPALPVFLNHLLIKNYFIQRLGFNMSVNHPEVRHRDRFEPMYYMNATIPAQVIRRFSTDQDIDAIGDHLEDIDTETLIIYGTDDRVTPASDGAIFDKRLPLSRLVLIESVGHLPFLEAPAAVENAIRAFLNDVAD